MDANLFLSCFNSINHQSENKYLLMNQVGIHMINKITDSTRAHLQPHWCCRTFS